MPITINGVTHPIDSDPKDPTGTTAGSGDLGALAATAGLAIANAQATADEALSRSGTSVAGIVDTYADLPTDPHDGQAYIVTDETAMYVWVEVNDEWVGPVPVQGAATEAAVADAVAKPAPRAVLDARYARPGAANTFTAKQVVPVLQFGNGTESDAILITESESLNGRRVSVQPIDQGATDRTSQIELLPGANVSQDTTGPGMVTQTSLLMFGKTGTHYERLLIMSRGKEFSIITSRRGDGQMRPILFQTSVTSDGVEPDSTTPVFSIRPDATARVHTTLTFGGAGDASMSRFAANAIRTPGQFMADDTITSRRGTPQEVRIGNAGGFGVPALAFGNGSGGTDAYIIRIGTGHLRTTGEFEIDGALNHDGSTAGFYGATPVAKPTGVPVTAEGIHAALVTLGLIGA